MFGSLLTLIILVFLVQKVIIIYKSKAAEYLIKYKSLKQADLPFTTLTPTVPPVCNCNQCQVKIN
ncbi:hypothetical protein CO007_00480 [Candidatus Roizmanbacteria bacterium CG_4_8_14_3_um_filter_36_10]|uniref:Uncharacterized protein n=2 Tax=Candidatus Roizmaniibacteriota TaxID=1752723 RepID=A0A2M8KM45_9BACT|nr:MAG: hypothetical protein CO166_00550 [Candidatus Roizmanbacteria bacterium CG_4_9_14_3_um_filter_36_11]PJC82252.1 MAG: hypothetical protein CO007_00480 [Candidatus Roizmanbacteria bacterium CG_4_8_14_3_um_filter_36_10]PJE60992.1 MAG: hypothetical protein COU86_01325 [Candidatus Roizmanbacteria bacterium CG10_big_fil_rev_8_21_14_0_10_36_26]